MVKIITIVCWIITALVLIGLAIWFLTGNLFGFQTNWDFNLPRIHIGSFATGPYEEVGSYKLPASDISTIRVNWTSGEVNVKPYDGTEIQMTEYARRSLEQGESLKYQVSGSTLEIKYVSSDVISFNIISKKLELLVPRELADSLNKLTVDAVSADINVEDFAAESISIDNTSGSVQLLNLTAGSVGIDTVSGEVNISDVTLDELSLETVSGGMRLKDADVDSVKTESMSGDLSLSGTFDRAEASSISGEISLISDTVLSSLSCASTSGDIFAAIPDDQVLTVSYSTVSGSFSSEIAVRNTGAADYDFATISGDIPLKAA